MEYGSTQFYLHDDIDQYSNRTTYAGETYNSLKSTPNISDVIMASMASQITSLTIVYSTVYSDADQRKPRHWPLCGEVTGQ